VSDISGFEVDDALIIAEQIELQSPTTCITPVVASAKNRHSITNTL
jgi:hypothetical protein